MFAGALEILTSIVRKKEFTSLMLKGPKFRETRSFKWQQDFISNMDSLENCARRCESPKINNLIPCQNGFKV
jgi:hypothetical protein